MTASLKLLECKKLVSLVKRNTKSYFKNKFTFFMSLITPLILLVLFVTFLRNVYIDSFKSIFDGAEVDNKILNGVVGAWLMSSILSVSSVTVAFCSNIIMIEDKMNGVINDFNVSATKGTTITISYFISNFFVTLLIMVIIMLIGHIYIAAVGWYLSFGDVMLILADIIINVLFGTLLAGVVESFISTQGGMSAVSTLVSSMYGFICGAYMPLSQFSEGLRNILSLLPGTYGVGILRNHYMGGYINALADIGISSEKLNIVRDSFDANLYIFGNEVPLGVMYAILFGTCAVLLAAYVAIVMVKNKRK